MWKFLFIFCERTVHMSLRMFGLLKETFSYYLFLFLILLVVIEPFLFDLYKICVILSVYCLMGEIPPVIAVRIL